MKQTKKQAPFQRGFLCGLGVLLLAGSLALGNDEPVPAGVLPPPGDPFALRGTGTEEGGFVSVPPAALPAGIRVLGILTPGSGEAVGVLKLPGANTLHFVREGDVLQYEPVPVRRRVTPAGGEQRTRDTEPRGARQFESAISSPANPVYLLIVSIGENQIEIAPRARPRETRIYR